MRELTMKDVKSVGLGILQAFHDFCISNNIEYSLAYGTLLGAIRHSGFIPWDDDIDIIMTRSNFERFCKEYSNNDYFELIVPFEGESLIAFARLCDKKHTLVNDETYPWSEHRHGLWIDIFPLDELPDDKDRAKETIDRLRFAWIIGNHLRSARNNKIENKTILGYIKFLAARCIFRFIQPTIIQEKFLNKHRLEHSKTIGNLSFLRYGYKENYKKAWFEDYIDISFEGHTFRCISSCDEYLRQIYNNYMELPPLEDRIPIHSFYKYYWKDS